MKKSVIIAVLALFLLGGVFFWLVSGSSTKHAPQDVVTIELPDSYEK